MTMSVSLSCSTVINIYKSRYRHVLHDFLEERDSLVRKLPLGNDDVSYIVHVVSIQFLCCDGYCE